MEEVLGRWDALSITSDEDGVLRVDDSLLDKGKEVCQFKLMGKVLSLKPFNREAFKRTICSLWRMKKGLFIKAIGNDLFLFSFDNKEEGDRVFATELWHFDNSLVVLKEIGANDVMAWKDWSYTKFWVQIFNLLARGMIQEIGEIIGRGFKKCLEVIIDATRRCHR